MQDKATLLSERTLMEFPRREFLKRMTESKISLNSHQLIELERSHGDQTTMTWNGRRTPLQPKSDASVIKFSVVLCWTNGTAVSIKFLMWNWDKRCYDTIIVVCSYLMPFNRQMVASKWFNSLMKFYEAS